MSAPNSAAQSLAGSHFATILSARSRNFVGLFKVPTARLQPCGGQRPLSLTWAQELKEKLEEGIDRAAYPLKVILDSNTMLPKLEKTLEIAGPGKIPWIPPEVPVRVYEGQHRVAACNLLVDEKTHWWYAEVYRNDLQAEHPAEVLSMMFLSNEKPIILPNDDAARFMTMYRLRELTDQGTIPEATYDICLNRLVRTIENTNTRQGLRNIMRSRTLSKAVADMICKPFLAPCFNGQTWGKKLVKGRFYGLAACLVEEMTRQCTLLQEGTMDLDSKPFELSAQSCGWDQLKSASKKSSNHAWKVLKGGVTGAIERVSKRPGDFITPLNPSGEEEWTLKDRVLLPSVLTSTMMENTLTETYQVAQHLIHMVAGPEYLEKYTANSAHSGNDDHPAGVITKVLGRTTNVTDRIICHMWHHRGGLLQSLNVIGITGASETSPNSYRELLRQSKQWWTLLRLFKKHCLPTGLLHGLKLPTTFEEPPSMSVHLPDKESNDSGADNTESSVESCTMGKAVNSPSASAVGGTEESSILVEDPATLIDPLPEPGPTPVEPSPMVVDPGANHQRLVKQAAYGGTRAAKRAKRKSPISETSEYVGKDQLNQAESAEPPRKQFRCHGAAISRLQTLEAHVPSMQASEAQALDELIQLVIDLQGDSHSARIFEGLSQKIQSLTYRARKASTMAAQMSRAYDHDGGDDEPFESDLLGEGIALEELGVVEEQMDAEIEKETEEDEGGEQTEPEEE